MKVRLMLLLLLTTALPYYVQGLTRLADLGMHEGGF